MRGRGACFVAESMPSDACRALPAPRAVGCQRPARLRTVRLVGSTEPFDPGRRRRRASEASRGRAHAVRARKATSSSSMPRLSAHKTHGKGCPFDARRRPPRRTGPRP